MRHTRHHGQLKWVTEISVTPLLDLVFILLFAFMIALPLVSRTDKLLSKPDASTSATTAHSIPTPEDTITVSLQANDSVLWEGSEILEIELEARLRETIRSRPLLGIILEMPPDLPVARLVSPMAILQDAGVQNTAIRLTTAAQ